jgi:hypothetical protein
MRIDRFRLLALAANAGLTIQAPAADSDQPTPPELKQQNQALQQRVHDLEIKQDQAAHSRDIDKVTREVLADADKRSQLLDAQSFTAGYKDGFFIRTLDGTFAFHPWIQLQFRNETNFRKDVAGSDDNDLENGFELRRVKLGFDGNVFSPNLLYGFVWATDRHNGGLVLEEAWGKYRLNDSFAMKAGQYKGPFAHESLVSSKKLMAAERTLLTDQFTGGDNFLQGVSFIYNDQLKKGPIRAEGAFTDGIKSDANENFQDFPANHADFGLEGRVEYFVMGAQKDYDDFEAFNTRQDLLVVGGALDWTEAGNTDFFLQTVDAQYENRNGLGLYGAFYGRYTQNAPAGVNPAPPAVAPTDKDLYDWGFIAQGGYLIQQRWEPFARYSFIDFDSDGLGDGVENQVHEITVGLNYFVYGHNAKFTLDATWLPNGSPVADDGAGILSNDGNSEFILRAQFQLVI